LLNIISIIYKKKINMRRINSFNFAHYKILGAKFSSFFLMLFITACFASCLTEDELTESNYVSVTVKTTAATSVTATSAKSGGVITVTKNQNVKVRGVCWSTSQNPTVNLSTKTTDGTGSGTFSSTITGLTGETTYYVRAYSTNNLETVYGDQVIFITTAAGSTGLPSITTIKATPITSSTASSGGDITDDGNLTITAQGVCWSTSINPTTNLLTKTSEPTDNPTFTSTLTGLSPNTTYYVRAYATNSAGTAYGVNLVSFTTSSVGLPTLSTNVATVLTSASATSGGNITSDGGYAITARGVCWSTTTKPTTALSTKTSNSTGTGVFTSSLTGLSANTTYYVRAYAVNSMGTSYGDELILKTFTGTLTDFDGNVYHTVTIGSQVWMVENLKTTRYNDGTSIQLVTDTAAWRQLATSPGYCWYNNNVIIYGNTYGAMYNWYTVNTGKLAPTGWHVPTDAEWTILTVFLGGESVAGGKLKETGFAHWLNPNTEATNETGFTAMGGGWRDRYDGSSYKSLNEYGYWWSSTSGDGRGREINYYTGNVKRANYYANYGFSVRCVKN